MKKTKWREIVCFCNHAAERKGLRMSLFYWVTFCADIRRAMLGQNFNVDIVLTTVTVGNVTWNRVISCSKTEETHKTSSCILTFLLKFKYVDPNCVSSMCSSFTLCLYVSCLVHEGRVTPTAAIAMNIHLNHVLYPRKHTDSTLLKFQREVISFFNISRKTLKCLIFLVFKLMLYFL